MWINSHKASTHVYTPPDLKYVTMTFKKKMACHLFYLMIWTKLPNTSMHGIRGT